MRFVSSTLFAVLIASAAALAQQPAPGEKPVTILTGCLRSSAADPAIAGPSGRIYTLEVTDPPAKPAATSAAGTPAPPPPSKTTYSLSADESLGLQRHADHEVQLTGSLRTPAQSPQATARTGTEARTKPEPTGGGHRTFTVTAVKMLSTKC